MSLTPPPGPRLTQVGVNEVTGLPIWADAATGTILDDGSELGSGKPLEVTVTHGNSPWPLAIAFGLLAVGLLAGTRKRG